MSAGCTGRLVAVLTPKDNPRFRECFVRSHLQLSTRALASSSLEFDKATVRQSVTLKKCFSRPMNVDWSHRGASMSNELKAIVVVLKKLHAFKRYWGKKGEDSQKHHRAATSGRATAALSRDLDTLTKCNSRSPHTRPDDLCTAKAVCPCVCFEIVWNRTQLLIINQLWENIQTICQSLVCPHFSCAKWCFFVWFYGQIIVLILSE